MGIRTRFIAAMLAAATVTAVVVGTAASAAPASPTASAPGSGKQGGKPDRPDKDAVLAKIAASLGVSVERLVTALDHLKAAIGKGTDKSVAVAAFAKELKVSVADAEKALQALGDAKQKPGKDKDKGVPEEAVQLLAAELHISAGRARQVFKDLEKVDGKGEDIVNDKAFIAIAKGLGISPQRLLQVLIKVKQELAGKEPKPATK